MERFPFFLVPNFNCNFEDCVGGTSGRFCDCVALLTTGLGSNIKVQYRV